MNDRFDQSLSDALRRDTPTHDAALTARVVDRWAAERAAARRRRITLATLGPLSVAALIAVSALMVHVVVTTGDPDPADHAQRLAAGQAMTALVRDTRVTATVNRESIHRAIDATTSLFSGETALSLLVRDAGDDLMMMEPTP